MSSEETNNELGEKIRQLRLRKTQIHNGHSWTQDDLAVAINSDKAHINRLEKGRQMPNDRTIKSICAALDTSWNEEKELLALSGHMPPLPSPTEDDIHNIRTSVLRYMSEMAYPATLLDNELRVWMVNDIQAYTFYGYPNAKKFLDNCEGLRFIEMLMTPSFYDWFSKLIVNFDEFFRRQVFRFAEVYIKHQREDEYINILAHFLKHRRFRAVWQSLWEEQPERHNIIFFNHQILDVDHPDLGKHSIQIWHSHFVQDNRFEISAHIPNDIKTRKLFEQLPFSQNQQ